MTNIETIRAMPPEALAQLITQLCAYFDDDFDAIIYACPDGESIWASQADDQAAVCGRAVDHNREWLLKQSKSSTTDYCGDPAVQIAFDAWAAAQSGDTAQNET